MSVGPHALQETELQSAKVIVNPTASGGRVGRQWPTWAQALRARGLEFKAEYSREAGHATTLARDAVADGYRYVIAVGGDGTVNEVVNGLFASGRTPKDLVLGILPGGTGSDFVRTLGIPRNTEEATPILAGHESRPVDVGVIQCMHGGEPIQRYFVNVAGVGFDGEVSTRVNRVSKRIRGTIPYLSSLLVTLLSYRNKDVTICFDGSEIAGKYNSVIICNGQYFGGGMWIGPRALADDGAFDVVTLGNLNRIELLLNLPRIYNGTHLTHPKVATFRAHDVEVRAGQKMFIQAEGELIGEAPATFRLLPAALNIRA